MNEPGNRTLRYICLMFFILLFPSLVHSDYITRFGAEILKRSDLVIQGMHIRTIEMAKGGGKLLYFKIDTIFKGNVEVSREIGVLYLLAPAFGKDRQWVIFLKRLSSVHIFESIGEFVAEDEEGKTKKECLKKILNIELLPSIPARKKAYLEYCLDNFVSQQAWAREHALVEWKHLISRHRDILDDSSLARLQKIYEDIPEISIKNRLQKDIISLKKSSSRKESVSLPLQKDIFEKIQQAQKTIESGSVQEKIGAVQWVGVLPAVISQKVLLQALKDPCPHVRALAVFFLGIHGNRESVEPLLDLLRTDASLRVRKNAIVSLGKLSAFQAVSEIDRYVHLPYTRDAALEALRKLSLENE